jgi:ABC-type bacteriocin/lantibiotic exporter with double-glycine peptidase domain
MAMVYAVNSQIQEILTGLSAIVIIIIGGVAVATKSMSLGEFLSFYLAALYLNKYINILTSSIPDIITGNESLTTLYKLSETEDLDTLLGSRKIEFAGNLTIQDVSFSYGSSSVLKKINLSIKPGAKIAIVGPNGSGKTTIMNLILGFYQPATGQITAEEIEYKYLDMVDFRRQLGVVFQHPPLFSGSVTENITYGSPDIDFSQLKSSAGYALAHDFIENLPQGYDTQIGEDGVLLSGGECQRIAIARALYRNPGILILDEPTNHLDRSKVEEIMLSLDKIDNKPAILIISHDQSVIEHVDEVYQLTDGVLTRIK